MDSNLSSPVRSSSSNNDYESSEGNTPITATAHASIASMPEPTAREEGPRQGKGSLPGRSAVDAPSSSSSTQQRQRPDEGGRAQSVFADLGIWERIGQYQAGEKGSDFWNGDVAAAEGHLSLMVSRHVEGDPLSYTQSGMRSAAANGKMEVVRWLHDYTDVAQMPSAMDAAAAGGHLEVRDCL